MFCRLLAPVQVILPQKIPQHHSETFLLHTDVQKVVKGTSLMHPTHQKLPGHINSVVWPTLTGKSHVGAFIYRIESRILFYQKILSTKKEEMFIKWCSLHCNDL